MKKLAVCSVVLALAVVFVPQGQAASQCIHFTNFCDSIQIQTTSGSSGIVVYGGWDWLCSSNWTDATVAGIARAGHAILGTRPYSQAYNYLSVYSFIFDFNLNSKLFDLYATNGNTVIVFQTNQPWTTTSGACRADDHSHSKPRTILGL